MPKLLKTIGKVALTALAFWVVFRRLDARAVGAQLGHANWGWVAMATGLFVVSKLISVRRLQGLFGVIGIRLSGSTNRALYWLGMFYNLFLPGGIGGDGYKVWLLSSQTNTPVGQLITATLLDRIIGLLPLLSLTLVLLPLLPNHPFGQYTTWLGWSILPGIVGIHGGAILISKRFFPVFAPLLCWSTGLSVGVQAAQGLCVWALVQAIGGNAAPTIQEAVAWQVIFLVSSVVAALPLTMGGAGARELTFLTGAGWLGLSGPVAVSVSLLFYSITALVSLTGAYFAVNDTALQRITAA